MDDRTMSTAAAQAQRWVLAVGGVVAVVGLAAGLGVFGGPPIAESGDGRLSAEASLVAPAGPAFSIWTPIYAGLLALAAWQWAPSRLGHPRLRPVGWAVAVSMVANTGWVLAAQADLLPLTVALIVTILAALAIAYGRLLGSRPEGVLERVVLDGTVGLYLGWVTVATVANVTAALLDAGVTEPPFGQATWAVAMLLVAGAVGAAVSVLGRGRLAYPAAVVWGLTWVVVARTAGPTESGPAAVAAGAAAVAVVAATAWARLRGTGPAPAG